MDDLEKKLALEKEKRIRDAAMKLAAQSTRENQRLHALKSACTSKLRADGIRSCWNSQLDTDCGAIMELSEIVLPFIQFQKKDFRRACYFVVKTGSDLLDTDLLIVGKDVRELKMDQRFAFKNISSNFTMTVLLYGLELADKEKLKQLSPRAVFKVWAQVDLTLNDMTNRMKIHSLQLTTMAPKIPRIYGTLSCKLTGAVPVLYQTVYEGFLNVWADISGIPEWTMVWVQLKNAHFRGFNDPRTRNDMLFDIEITGELDISDVCKGRAYSFQLRDFAGRTVLAANCQRDKDDCIAKLVVHKKHLKKWGRLIGSYHLEESNIGGTPVKAPWSDNFLGSKTVNKPGRRSRSIEHQSVPRIETKNYVSQTVGGSRAVPSSKIINEIVDNSLGKKNRRRSNSLDSQAYLVGKSPTGSGIEFEPVKSKSESDNTFEISEFQEQLFIGEELDNQPSSMPMYKACEKHEVQGPTSLPAMHNRLQDPEIEKKLKTIRREPMRTSTKIDDLDIRTKYQNMNTIVDDVSPISSPTPEKTIVAPISPISPISPITAASKLRKEAYELRTSYANAMQNSPE